MLQKTLEFLKQQTGLDFEYDMRGYIVTPEKDRILYDVRHKRCWGKHGVIFVEEKPTRKNREYATIMEPSEFIEKIEKGEWV